ncbi:NADPH-dependent FMN reductase [Gilvimarinus polysaccharolyticus]|uniref:NADPH-dependent FMN reductase n=1 Tax=Gilvimarinus polysaccharolyticus TaxID=863921 RepID=UPI0006730F71|nr:NADPH-dependent FMN reductase [Gilvimarinus polysaccharolyticus]
MKVVAISGSLRKESFNSALLLAAREHFLTGEDALDVEWIEADIATIPLYNQDIDGDIKPESVAVLLNQIEHADVLVIATPEYNYGIPGALKNAIDWVSRPAYRSVLAHIPALIMSASMSPAGGVRAQGQLKQVLGGTLTAVFPCPEFAVGSAHTCFEDGKLTDAVTAQKLERLVTDFVGWVNADVDFDD